MTFKVPPAPAIGAKLYRPHNRGPYHVVAVLEGQAADPHPYLVVVRRWLRSKQRWDHEIVDPIALGVGLYREGENTVT